MRNDSKLLRFLLRSPVCFILFIIIPAALILSTTLHVPLPLRITSKMLLLNNLGALLLIAVRFLYYLAGLRRSIRYGETPRPSGDATAETRSGAQIREELSGKGFNWSADGAYGEKHDRGYLGTTLVYAGMFLLLFIGTWENMYQFSGTLLHGIGKPADLSSRGAYFPLLKGPLASPAGLPQLEVTKQFFPSSDYPKGATEIVLLSKEGKGQGKAILHGSGDPYKYKGFDIYLSKLLVDVALRVKLKDKDKDIEIYSNDVKFLPLPKNDSGYSMYGTFQGDGGHEGEAFYDPDGKRFRFTLTRDGKKVMDMEYVLYQYREKVESNYVVALTAMGNWSELHVVRRRHMGLLWVGGIIALLGLVMRIAIRPQRVWLEETPEGCRVWTAGKNPLRVES